MQERRSHSRELINAQGRLYHSAFGSLDCFVKDVSDIGMYVKIENIPEDIPVDGEECIQLELFCMDVIFSMECIRHNGHGIVLRFVKEKE